MKKKHLRMFRHILAGAMVLTSMVSVQAQVTNPETWSSFVESGANPSVVDTFRWQLFAKAEQNNWNYTLGGGAIISNDQKTLKMPLSSSVAFEKYLFWVMIVYVFSWALKLIHWCQEKC